MKYISLNWTLALKFSIGKKKRMRDCQILMAHDCRLYIGNTYVAYCVWSVYNVYSVFAIHYKYIVEVLGKTIRRTGMIDHSFERKFHGACQRPSFTIFSRLILNKIHDNSKT